ncbi:MAG: methyltransferase domain-containing protein [Candidatus Moranbacteria bacterium]|nr:methyltransferase domain-containing protein [Candidatus Moranbacteria bacterium]OIQ04547.1 MAG: hypothetical protein AUK58_00035 [Candidatus Moranbacteria bacterium CG2_30_41_165]PIP25896.1 MAG: hypothetical protein COX32_00935 [Candidatus Moranbacteria bacterium CG23_combo_of_CG06-09_8_20_14_all_41_28]PIV86299.1 MAG: hypothetical protein COW50_02230 [Candidatus Moranbacteria bacterium CG17_big_fil_post_rev_8_21_14_2_50_41_107]PIW94209.1 MAG: hypothetical protein COZ86_02270 [Candidatus Mora
MNTPAGLTFVDPTVVVNQLKIEPGAIVADFGCGAGFFSFEFAKRVGDGGKVYALDVLPSALEVVTSGAKNYNLTNMVPKRVNLEKENGSGLSSNSVDWVVIKDILFQNQKKNIIFTEVNRILKTGGHAVIMEWDPSESLVGPDKELRISKEALKTLVTDAHLTIEEEINVGGYHYAFLVRK